MFLALGGDDFDWVAKSAEGRSGGLIVLWSRGCFVMSSQFQGRHFLGLEGLWGNEQVRVTIVNVYAPCDLRGKKALWEELVNSLEARGIDGVSWGTLTQ